LQGVITGDEVSVSSPSYAFASAGVGTGIAVTTTESYTLSGTAAANYTLTQPTSALTATISSKELMVTGLSAANKEYDGTTDATVSGGELQGVITGDEVSVSSPSYAFASAGVGTGIAVSSTESYSLIGSAAGNYTLTQPSVALTAAISSKELTVTGITATNKVYDGTTEATVSAGELQGVITGDAVGVSSPSYVFSSAGVGTGIAVSSTESYSLIGSAAGNYTLTQPSVAFTADISARGLAITADAITKAKDDTDPELTFQITTGNKIDGDEFSGSLEREQGEEVGVYAILNGNVTLGSNYEITFIGADFTITSTASIEDSFITKSIVLYPNPVKDRLFIEVDAGIEIKEIQVYDLIGKRIKLMKGPQSSISLKRLPKGVYYIKIKTNLGTGVKRILKN
jgi:hypothetical protein